MKRILLLISILHLIVYLKAQTSVVSWSNEFEEKTSENRGMILQASKDFIYLSTGYQKRNKFGSGLEPKITPGIIKFDRSFKIIKENTYGLLETDASPERKIKYVDIITLGNNFALITSKFEAGSHTKNYYAQKINSSSLEPEGKVISLLTVEQAPENFDFKYYYSPDSSKLLFYSRSDLKKSEGEQIKFNVFDNNLNIVFSAVKKVQPQIKGLAPCFAINNSGTVVFIEFPVSKNRNKKEREYDVKLESTSDGNFKQGINLPIENNRFIDHYDIKANSSGEFVFIYLAKSDDKKIINEINSIKIDSQGEKVVFQKDNIMDSKIVERAEKLLKDYKRAEDGFRDPSITILMDNDGETSAVVEYNLEHFDDGDFKNYSTTIIVCRFNQSGELMWTSLIPRDVHAADFTYYLYPAIFSANDKLRVLFNDYPENRNIITQEGDKAKITVSCKRMSICSAEYDTNGKLSLNEVGSYDQIAVNLYGRGSKQINDNESILFGWNPFNRSFKIGVMKLK